MGRKAESAHTFVRDPRFGLVKEITVVRCDDGCVYEFVETEDFPASKPPRLRRAYQPDGSMSHTSKKILPSAVEETVESLFGGWSK